MAQPTLTFYGGVHEIGGNKILLEQGDTRVFLDFGTSFGKRAQFFEEYLNPRPGAGLLDVLETGLLPPLDGIYREDLVREGLWERFKNNSRYRRVSAQAVLLSHAHFDHCGHISYLKTDIPVYSTAMTAFIIKAMQDTGPSNLEKEVCYCSPRVVKEGYLGVEKNQSYHQRPFHFLDGAAESSEATAFWSASPALKKMSCAAPGGRCGQIGPLSLRYYPVDHSVFGAAAFALETAAGWVAYSGDLRLHGGQGENTWRFAQEARELHPHTLICEGTRAGHEKTITEAEVLLNAFKAVSAASGLVIADFGPRNVERLLTFSHIAAETKRKLVILPKDAYLLEAMSLASPKAPGLAAQPNILIYSELKGVLKGWERQLGQEYPDRLVAPKDIAASPRDFILCFSFWDVNELIDISPKGGLYIYSSSEVFDEEGAMDMRRLHNWLRHFEMTPMGLPQEKLDWRVPEAEQGLHASGHAGGPELLEIIRHIQPKVLVPIHTQDPGYFVRSLEGTNIKVLLPEYGVPVKLA